MKASLVLILGNLFIGISIILSCTSYTYYFENVNVHKTRKQHIKIITSYHNLIRLKILTLKCLQPQNLKGSIVSIFHHISVNEMTGYPLEMTQNTPNINQNCKVQKIHNETKK